MAGAPPGAGGNDKDPQVARGLWLAVVLLLLAAAVVLNTSDGPAPPSAAVAMATEAEPVSEVAATLPAAAASVAPTATSPQPPPPPAPGPTPAPRVRAAAVPAPPLPPTPPLPPPLGPPANRPPPPPPARSGLGPYRGLGTWVDVYDWSHSYADRGQPTVSPDHVDQMADMGVQTLYIQASKHDAPGDLVEPDLLQQYIDRARRRGMRVVAWYLPTLVDTGRDMQRLMAIAGLRNVDSLAVDIEARDVKDVNERNRRLVELSSGLRRALPARTLGAIVLPPVVLEVINPRYWPSFPYREIAPSYDVWMTMGYWTFRTKASGYRDPYRYTRENVERLRTNVGQPGLPVHPIGGIGDRSSEADVEAYKRAAADTRSIGGGLYDWHTTRAQLWSGLRGFRG